MRSAYEVAFVAAVGGEVLVVAAVLWQAIKTAPADAPISTVLSWAVVAAILFTSAMMLTSLVSGTFGEVMELGTLLPYASAFGMTTSGVIWLSRRPVKKPGRLLGPGSTAYLLPIASGLAAGAVGAI
ncbi:MAG: hypothetical protein ACR2FG_08370 [Marmoricola sp.]